MYELFLEKQEINLILNLLPVGPIPSGLDPTFYRTLNYSDEVKLQATINDLREKLEGIIT